MKVIIVVLILYPGQMLQVELCTPFNDKPSTAYAEVNSIYLPTSACKVAPQTEIIYMHNQ